MIAEERKNTHMTHMEDLVLLGKPGLDELNNYLDSLNKKSDKIRMTTKVDGAPAVICWSHIEGYPDNSISLKSFVNGPKNALSSVDDIEERYSDRPGMVLMLRYCLELAHCIPSGEAWQGDCLFTKNSKKERKINGKKYITFQPNKIIYAFGNDNPGYENVKNADFGICFHTKYFIKNDKLAQGFNVNAEDLNNVPSNIYVLSPAISREENNSQIDLTELKELEAKLLNDPFYEDLINNKMFQKYWNTFENANISDKKVTKLDINTFFEDLVNYVNDKMKKEFDTKVGKLKTDAGKAKAEEQYKIALEELQDILKQRKETLINLVKTINCVADIKMELWSKLKDYNSGYFTFYQKKTGEYEPGSSEGIAMSDDDGNVVKIVDRSQFSNINRSDEYTSGFDHNESLEEDANEYILSDHIEKLLVNSGFKENEAFSNTTHGRQRAFTYSFGNGNDDGDFISIQFNYDYKGGVEVEYWSKNMPLDNGDYYTRDYVLPVSKEQFNSEDEFMKWFAKFNESLDEGVNELNDQELDKFVDTLYDLGFRRTDEEMYAEFIYDFNDGAYITIEIHPDAINLFFTPVNENDETYKQFFKVGDAIKFIEDTLEESLREAYQISKDEFINYIKELGFKFIIRLDARESDKYIYKYDNDAKINLYVNDNDTVDIYYSEGPKIISKKHNMSFDKAYEFIRGTVEESLTEAMNDTAILIWGRMNPITKGHMAMIDFAKKQGGDTFVYLSHKQDKDKNPLPYDRKIYWAQKAAGDVVKESDANVVIKALQEIQAQGYDNLIYVCGSDRYEEMKALLNKYNGQQDKQGNIPFKFDTIEVRQFGDERLTEEIALEKCSASLARECVKKNDFETFKQVVPFDELDAKELYEELRKNMDIQEMLEELNQLNEKEDKLYDRKLSKSVDSVASAYNLIRDEINKLNIADDVKEEVFNVIKKVELLTNSIDISELNIKNVMNFMDVTNLNIVTDLMQFVSQFSTAAELNKLVSKPRKLTFSDNANIRQDALTILSEKTVNNLSKFRPVKNSVSTGIGEVLIATIYKGGALPVKGEHGDVVINGEHLEVKTDNGVIGPFRQNKILYDYIRPMLKATGAVGARGNVGNGVRSNFKNIKLTPEQLNTINDIGENIGVKFDTNTTQLNVFDTLFSLALREYLGEGEKILLTNGDSKNPKLSKSIIINRTDTAEKLESKGVNITFADDRNSGDKFKITLK